VTAVRRLGEPWGIAIAVVALLVAIAALVYVSQFVIERNSLTRSSDPASLREVREVDKLSAEIRQIRSDTGGSLFWLKLLAVLVTVGGAVGGYLIGQSRTTRKRLEFENRRKVDELYQQMVVELSSDSDLLRTAAAVKLGELLRAFPQEWQVSESRLEELVQLTKQVLAASLAIETQAKVLKTLTIQVVLHRPWAGDAEATRRCYPWTDRTPPAAKEAYGDLRQADLSNARATDAYWARVDFTYADFYKAVLGSTSFREAILVGAQFREADLQAAVLSGADCEGATFKLAVAAGADFSRANLSGAVFDEVDLRGACLDEARLTGAKLRGPKVHGVTLAGAAVDGVEGEVDVSPEGDGSALVSAADWLKAAA
jgi:uncharacterized protein YjbI with pentapeptide repeats